ncbi:MAG: hypothetical protein GY811_13590 [Myxococcales bacterium]|nr:hypothetical protein [Myxococcales bacterium]
MRACALVGDYEYQPNASDVVTFSESLDWIALSDEATEGGTLTQWRTRRTATLEIDASNHWSTIQEADFFCGYDHEIGFEIEVDATSGEVFSFRPGINCVVC